MGFGIFVYCEVIELNFCNFQYNLRRNIIKRSEDDFELNSSSERYSSINDEGKNDEIENNDSLSKNYYELQNKNKK